MILEKSQETDAQVSWEDQQNINKFSKLVQKLDYIEQVQADRKQELELLIDLLAEIELNDEDEAVKYKIGEAFIQMTTAKAKEMIDRKESELKENLKDLDDEQSTINKELAKLKQLLYAKFGNSINLERQ
jgi:prefoldin subunit 4